MQYLGIVFSMCFYSAVANAQDVPDQYAEMTYEEMRHIDQASLGHTERAVFKKAYNKAKKLRDKKRAQAIHNNKVLKHLQLFYHAYDNTVVEHDDFEAFIEISGIEHSTKDANKNGTPSLPQLALKSLFYPENQKLNLELHIIKHFTVNGLDQVWNNSLIVSPEVYMSRKGHWKNYTKATLRGGVKRELTPVRRYMGNCSPKCLFKEEFIVTLNMNDLNVAVNRGKPFDIKISAATDNSFIASIPLPYVYGFLQRMSEAHPHLAQLSAISTSGRKHFEQQLIQ